MIGLPVKLCNFKRAIKMQGTVHSHALNEVKINSANDFLAIEKQMAEIKSG
jgi:hypothetical protein